MWGMSYETISVRMNRSDPSIRWGFTLRQQGSKVIIATVERDSLSEKAGLREGDEVQSVCGFQSQGLDVQRANRIIEGARLEVNFSLQRYVTSHACLPWTLTEKDNKLIVDEVRPGFGSEFSKNLSSTNANWQQQQSNGGVRNQPIQYTGQPANQGYQTGANYQSSYSSSQQQQQSSTSNGAPLGAALSPQPKTVFHSPSSFATSMKNSSYMQERNVPISQTYSTYNSTSGQFGAKGATGATGAGAQSRSRQPVRAAAPFGASTGSGAAAHSAQSERPAVIAAPPPSSYSYSGGAQAASPYGTGAGGTPLNQGMFIQTNQLQSPSQLSSQYSPGGTRINYRSPSPRTRAQLSPGSGIAHLQYNSPMNLYSSESAGEQFEQQTGQKIESLDRLKSKSPAYLTSETKKLIEEHEGRRHSGPSPSSQSSAFKRISRAVGEPVY